MVSIHSEHIGVLCIFFYNAAHLSTSEPVKGFIEAGWKGKNSLAFKASDAVLKTSPVLCLVKELDEISPESGTLEDGHNAISP